MESVNAPQQYILATPMNERRVLTLATVTYICDEYTIQPKLEAISRRDALPRRLYRVFVRTTVAYISA